MIFTFLCQVSAMIKSLGSGSNSRADSVSKTKVPIAVNSYVDETLFGKPKFAAVMKSPDKNKEPDLTRKLGTGSCSPSASRLANSNCETFTITKKSLDNMLQVNVDVSTLLSLPSNAVCCICSVFFILAEPLDSYNRATRGQERRHRGIILEGV